MLTRTCAAGLQALLCLARTDPLAGPASPRVMAGRIDISASYLAKVLRELTRAGILVARHGAKGGVRLSRAARNIRLLDVIEALQGPVATPATATGGRAMVGPRGWARAMARVEASLADVLARWTLADLADLADAAEPRSRSARRTGRERT